MLIGTVDNRKKLVFADVEIKDDGTFSVSFDEVAAFIADDEYCRERAENWVDSMGEDTFNDLIKRFDCKPSNLVDELMRYEGYDFAIDTSLYPEIFFIPEISDDDIMFESLGCGQLDPQDIQGFTPLYPRFTEKLLKLWDEYHLETLPLDEKEKLADLKMEYYNDLNESGWIEGWLREVF